MVKLLCAALVITMALILSGSGIVGADDVTITADPSYATAAPNVTASEATGVTAGSATLHGNITDNGGGDITMRGFEWGTTTGNYTWSWNETGSFGTGVFEHAVSNLTFCTDIYWRAFAINDYGQGNSTELDFTTDCYPGAPTDFTATEAFPSSVVLNWTKGEGANITIIRAGADGYPTSITDGYEVYSGNGTSVTIDGFALDLSSAYFSAWSQNVYGYSANHAETSIGDPIGLPAIVFAVGLCGFALWKRGWIRVILALSVVIWGAFAMPYDIKVAAPLLAMGAILFFMGILRMIEQRRQEVA